LFHTGSLIIWGAEGTDIKFNLEAIDPFHFLSYRLLISAIIGIIFIAAFRPKVAHTTRDIVTIIIYGLLGSTFGLGFLFLGLDRTTVLELGIIGAVGPLAVIVGAGLFLKEHVTKREKLGILIALLGTLFIVFAPVVLGQSAFKFEGNILILLFLASDAASVLIAKSMTKHKANPMVLASMSFIIGAATIIPFTLLSYSPTELVNTIIQMPLKYHLGVWYMAVLSGNVAYFFFLRGARSIEIGEAVLFSYLQPIISVPLAVFWLGEKLTVPFIVGGFIVASGVYIAEKKKH
jgi:drug/metabolite transporter (DMT)-like permease